MIRFKVPFTIFINADFLTKIICASWILLLSFCTPYDKRPLTIACSANMVNAIDEIVDSFNSKTGTECRVVIGSSGKLTAQIMEGAPYDIFLSADSKYPDKLYNAGIAIEPPITYAHGRLALWSVKMDSISIVLIKNNDHIKKIAVANPKTAPYGVAALQFLEKSKVLDELNHGLIYGENVGQVNQFVSTGAVDLGITAQSTIIAQAEEFEGSWKTIDSSLHEAIVQQYVIVSKSDRHKKSAFELAKFLSSQDCQDILLRWGYLLP